MTEQEKMLSGKIYDPSDEILSTLRVKAHKLSQQYNNTFEDQTAVRKQILDELLPNRGKGVYLQGPVQFDFWNELYYCDTGAPFQMAGETD